MYNKSLCCWSYYWSASFCESTSLYVNIWCVVNCVNGVLLKYHDTDWTKDIIVNRNTYKTNTGRSASDHVSTGPTETLSVLLYDTVLLYRRALRGSVILFVTRPSILWAVYKLGSLDEQSMSLVLNDQRNQHINTWMLFDPFQRQSIINNDYIY